MVGISEESAVIRSDAEIGRHGTSVLDSSGVDGGGDTNGVELALIPLFCRLIHAVRADVTASEKIGAGVASCEEVMERGHSLSLICCSASRAERIMAGVT